MATFISHNPAETEFLGECWGRVATRGMVVGLCGELGAGKTQLVKGLARGLGITARVHSPTFALVNKYSGGSLALIHLDLYRLETAAQIHEAGLDEFLQPDGVSVIEWAERWPELVPGGCDGLGESKGRGRRLWAQIEVLGETRRRITYDDSGA